jgi:hypothetical protein
LAVQLTSLEPTELCRVGVWEFISDDTARDETLCEPVTSIPASSLAGRVVALIVQLADGSAVPALLGNVDLRNPRLCRLFLTAALWLSSGRWFKLARHFDYNYEQNGPGALAIALNRSIDRVFPIAYDLSRFAIGNTRCILGTISAEPLERITRAEAIKLAAL